MGMFDKGTFQQIIKPEEQKRLLDLIPGEYQPGASEELIKIIEESRTNTDVRENWAKF
jgi:hypothetical protein